MFCGKCGKQIPEGAAFCGGCGARVAPAAQPAPAAPVMPQGIKLYLGTSGLTMINYKFEIKDEHGNVRYKAATVTESMVRQKAKVYYPNDVEIFEVFQQSKMTLTALNYDMIMNGQVITEILQKNKFSKYVYELPQFGISADGDFFSWNFEFTQRGRPVAKVSRKVMSWGDSYELDIYDRNLEMIILAAVIAVELVTIRQRSRRR